MAFENSAERYRPSEVQPSTVALLPSNHEYQQFFKPTSRNGSQPDFLDFGQTDIYNDKTMKVAQKVELQMPYQLEPALNKAASDGIATVGQIALDEINQRRAVDEINHIPAKNWDVAYKAFPELQSHFSEQQATALIKAIIANEIEHYDGFDLGQDFLLKANVSVNHSWTLGLTQLSLNAVRERADEFPKQLSGLKHSERETLMAPEEAPLLVAATVEHYIKQFTKYSYPINEETLGYAYNADLYAAPGHKDIMPTMQRLQASEHAANIRRWLSTFSNP